MPKIDIDCEKTVQIIAAELKRLREDKSVSKNELSQLSGVSRTTIRRIEEGERSPSIYILLLLTKSLEIDLWKLLKEATT